jgi:hypothetical protein
MADTGNIDGRIDFVIGVAVAADVVWAVVVLVPPCFDCGTAACVAIVPVENDNDA